MVALEQDFWLLHAGMLAPLGLQTRQALLTHNTYSTHLHMPLAIDAQVYSVTRFNLRLFHKLGAQHEAFYFFGVALNFIRVHGEANILHHRAAL